MPKQRIFWLAVLLALALAGCRGTPPDGGNAGGGTTFSGDTAIRWPNESSHTVFEIDVAGGESTFSRRNGIPLCAVYGDNRVVWLDTTQPNRTIVLFDVVEDIEIYDFVTDLTVNKRLFTYEGTAEDFYAEGERPVYERIVLDVNDTRHITDGFSDWPSGYFRDILETCTSISDTPALYEPSAGWLSVESAIYDPDAATIYWNEEGAGIDLNELADEPARLWVDDPATVNRLWNTMTNSPSYRQFQQNDDYYIIAFEVPNIHPTSPPAPAPDELERARTMPGERRDVEATG
jgi:hypothetical protein